MLERIRTGLQTTGLVVVDDWRRCALDARAYLAQHHDFSFSPLPLTGATAEAMDAWSTTGVRQGEQKDILHRLGWSAARSRQLAM
jgi:hypothetical protein